MHFKLSQKQKVLTLIDVSSRLAHKVNYVTFVFNLNGSPRENDACPSLCVRPVSGETQPLTSVC